jgi:hypothetical protein
MKPIYILFCLVITGVINAQVGNFDLQKVPQAPDYSKSNYWCAIPFYKDQCDFSSKYNPFVSDSGKLVDVFFVHPTTYMKGDNWNASVPNESIDKQTDLKPIKYQASAFNESCRIFAPRYRQAIIASFYDTVNGAKALELAYSDVKNAFDYYLKYHNQGRPFIIASHSQGTFHARRLLTEYIDGKPLQGQMVMAYLIGYPVETNLYKKIPICDDSTKIGGVVCWHSFKSGFIPIGINTFYNNSIVVNPITWRIDTSESAFSESKGAKGLKLNSCIRNRIKARIYKTILWVTVKYPIIRKRENLHALDYNLFWYDIKADIKRRIGLFGKQSFTP